MTFDISPRVGLTDNCGPISDPESKMALLAGIHDSVKKSIDLLNKMGQKYPEVVIQWDIKRDETGEWKLAFFEAVEYLADLKTFAG